MTTMQATPGSRSAADSVVGTLLLVLGLALNLTVIGMVIGVPLVIAGLALVAPE